jgi:hypothetical protein
MVMPVSDSDHNLRKRDDPVRPLHMNRPKGLVTALVAVGALLVGATGCNAGLGGPASSRAARDGQALGWVENRATRWRRA